MKGIGSDCATVKVTMFPILSSATQPVKPVLNRDADNLVRFSAPPDCSNNHDEDNYEDNYDEDNCEDNNRENYANKKDED